MSAVVAVLAGVPAIVRAVTPTPTPSPTGTVATSLGSPGITGFVVTFVLAIALIGLFLSLTRHLRIVDRRSRQLEEQDATAAEDAAEADPEPGVEPGVVPPAPDDEPGGR